MTLLGNAGPWHERLYLVGGLAPRYLVGKPPEGAPAHVGTTDVDLVIELVVDAKDFHAYRTLAANLKEAGFSSLDSCRWATDVDGVTVKVVAALALLQERFADVDRDGPGAYAAFLADPYDTEEIDRRRREAVAAVRRFTAAFRGTAPQ